MYTYVLYIRVYIYVCMYLCICVYIEMKPFELHSWHGVWKLMGVSFFLGVVIMVFFGRLHDHESHDHESHDHLSFLQRQMASMHEKHEKEMQLMHQQHKNHEKEMQVMHEKEMQTMHKQYEKQMHVMHERQLVIQKQMDLINAFTQIMHELQRLMDQYVAGIREYSYLKDIDNSWLSSLSRQERARMYQLENFLGTDEVIDVHVAIPIVRQRFEHTERFFSTQLSELEDALDKMDIEKMKQLQKSISKKHLSNHLREATGQIKSEMLSTSRALQKPGRLSQIASSIFQSVVAIISKFME